MHNLKYKKDTTKNAQRQKGTKIEKTKLVYAKYTDIFEQIEYLNYIKRTKIGTHEEENQLKRLSEKTTPGHDNIKP